MSPHAVVLMQDEAQFHAVQREVALRQFRRCGVRGGGGPDDAEIPANGVGVAFGGLVFWGAFAGSVALIGLVITKAGYARNFQNWDIGFKKMGALVIAFLATLGFYLGLIHLRLMAIPIFAAILILGLLIMIIRGRS